MARIALVVGGTGLIGRNVVTLLLKRAAWERVVVLVRRSLGIEDAKLTEHIVDFDKLEASYFEGVTDIFACLGTTMKVAKTKEAFRKIDHDYTVDVAKRAFKAGARRLALVSSVGANPKASNFYFQVKGETERDVRAIGWKSLVIVRPSMLRGDRHDSRPGESFGVAASSMFSFVLIGSLKKWRPIDASMVAEKLVTTLEGTVDGEQVLEYEALAGT